MIYKNDDGVNIIQFGTGDIEVCNGRVNDYDGEYSYPCLLLTEKEPGEIGNYTMNTNNEPAKESLYPDISFVFTDIRSVDVIIDQLKDIKTRFNNNGTKVLTPQEITNETEG